VADLEGMHLSPAYSNFLFGKLLQTSIFDSKCIKSSLLATEEVYSTPPDHLNGFKGPLCGRKGGGVEKGQKEEARGGIIPTTAVGHVLMFQTFLFSVVKI